MPRRKGEMPKDAIKNEHEGTNPQLEEEKAIKIPVKINEQDHMKEIPISRQRKTCNYCKEHKVACTGPLNGDSKCSMCSRKKMSCVFGLKIKPGPTPKSAENNEINNERGNQLLQGLVSALDRGVRSSGIGSGSGGGSGCSSGGHIGGANSPPVSPYDRKKLSALLKNARRSKLLLGGKKASPSRKMCSTRVGGSRVGGRSSHEEGGTMTTDGSPGGRSRADITLSATRQHKRTPKPSSWTGFSLNPETSMITFASTSPFPEPTTHTPPSHSTEGSAAIQQKISVMDDGRDRRGSSSTPLNFFPGQKKCPTSTPSTTSFSEHSDGCSVDTQVDDDDDDDYSESDIRVVPMGGFICKRQGTFSEHDGPLLAPISTATSTDQTKNPKSRHDDADASVAETQALEGVRPSMKRMHKDTNSFPRQRKHVPYSLVRKETHSTISARSLSPSPPSLPLPAAAAASSAATATSNSSIDSLLSLSKRSAGGEKSSLDLRSAGIRHSTTFSSRNWSENARRGLVPAPTLLYPRPQEFEDTDPTENFLKPRRNFEDYSSPCPRGVTIPEGPAFARSSVKQDDESSDGDRDDSSRNSGVKTGYDPRSIVDGGAIRIHEDSWRPQRREGASQEEARKRHLVAQQQWSPVLKSSCGRRVESESAGPEMVTEKTGHKRACCGSKLSGSDRALSGVITTNQKTTSETATSHGTSDKEMMTGDIIRSGGVGSSKSNSIRKNDNDSRDSSTYSAAKTLPLKKRRVENPDKTTETIEAEVGRQSVREENATVHCRTPMTSDADNYDSSLPDCA